MVGGGQSRRQPTPSEQPPVNISSMCAAGHLDMVRFLLEQGADLEHKTDEMHTALMEASMDGHVDVARYLLDRGAQVGYPLTMLPGEVWF